MINVHILRRFQKVRHHQDTIFPLLPIFIQQEHGLVVPQRHAQSFLHLLQQVVALAPLTHQEQLLKRLLLAKKPLDLFCIFIEVAAKPYQFRVQRNRSNKRRNFGTQLLIILRKQIAFYFLTDRCRIHRYTLLHFP